MDVLLGKVTQQAINYAIRSGITITAGYAIRQSSRLLKNVEGSDRKELQALQEKLDRKIKIIAPAIDMIELIAARGNTSLESAVSLTKELRWEIQTLGQRLSDAASAEENARRGGSKAKSKEQHDREIKLIIQETRKLLNRIEDAVPMINLAITTSGAKLSASLPATVSPSRLLQASTFVTAGDSKYVVSPGRPVQVGPTFTLSLYMLFASNVRPQDEEGFREMTWKEVMHKARVKLRRVPLDQMDEVSIRNSPQTTSANQDGLLQNRSNGYINGEARSDEFAYQILIVEDLDDDRVHTFEDEDAQPGSFDDVQQAGIREVVPIHQISKIFYADTGKILNIGADDVAHNPILLLKRDVNAIPPRRMMQNPEEYNHYEEGPSLTRPGEEDNEEQADIDAQLRREYTLAPQPISESRNEPLRGMWRLPADLDPEWMAFEVFNESEDSETEDEAEPLDLVTTRDFSAGTQPQRPSTPTRSSSIDPQITTSLSNLDLKDDRSAAATSSGHKLPPPRSPIPSSQTPFPIIRTSLSLLEMILRLCSLQQFQQQIHLAITDELLNFFLDESSTTGAGGDTDQRRRLRGEARRKVGWDPYDESPVKRRGEEYQYREAPEWEGGDRDRGSAYGRYAEGDGYSGWERSPSRGGYEDWDTPSGQGRQISLRSPTHTPNQPRLIKNQPGSSRGATPMADEGQVKGSRFTSPPTPASLARQREVFFQRENTSVKRGSPLARPRGRNTDEGIGTSPAYLKDPRENTA
ncbi:MAG: hypothetical protein M1834_003750 [Cirrosporium novae-zelandiae]|nr:MAG: hypothetical protein M1834_003750 [Cirrosporium novae-zelandiae]